MQLYKIMQCIKTIKLYDMCQNSTFCIIQPWSCLREVYVYDDNYVITQSDNQDNKIVWHVSELNILHYPAMILP